MKKYIFAAFISLIPISTYAAQHHNAVVQTVHSPDARACSFFRLEEVVEADPVNPNNPWFSVPLSH